MHKARLFLQNTVTNKLTRMTHTIPFQLTGYVAPPEVALPVLSELLQSGVDLVILETTQLSKVVAELRQHPVPAVADLAGRVVARWRDIALQVLQRDA